MRTSSSGLFKAFMVKFTPAAVPPIIRTPCNRASLKFAPSRLELSKPALERSAPLKSTSLRLAPFNSSHHHARYAQGFGGPGDLYALVGLRSLRWNADTEVQSLYISHNERMQLIIIIHQILPCDEVLSEKFPPPVDMCHSNEVA